MSILRNTRAIDSQRSRVYKAENKAFGPLRKTLRDVSTPELYRARVKEIMGSRYMARVFPEAVRIGEVTVKVTKQLRGAKAGFNGITTSPRMMIEPVLIHELTHTIIRRCWPVNVIRADDGRNYRSTREIPRELGFGRHYVVGHGPEFARVYLSLVRQFIGRAAQTQRPRFNPLAHSGAGCAGGVYPPDWANDPLRNHLPW